MYRDVPISQKFLDVASACRICSCSRVLHHSVASKTADDYFCYVYSTPTAPHPYRKQNWIIVSLLSELYQQPRILILNASSLHSVLQLNACCNLQSSEVKAMAALLVGVYHLENMVLDAAVVHIEYSKKVHVHVRWLRMLSVGVTQVSVVSASMYM